MGGEAAPLAAHPGEALRAPAGLPAPAALGVGGQVALLRGKKRWIGCFNEVKTKRQKYNVAKNVAETLVFFQRSQCARMI